MSIARERCVRECISPSCYREIYEFDAVNKPLVLSEYRLFVPDIHCVQRGLFVCSLWCLAGRRWNRCPVTFIQGMFCTAYRPVTKLIQYDRNLWSNRSKKHYSGQHLPKQLQRLQRLQNYYEYWKQTLALPFSLIIFVRSYQARSIVINSIDVTLGWMLQIIAQLSTFPPNSRR